MGDFSRLLAGFWQNKRFQDHPKCKKLNLINLSFADDLLLFSIGSDNRSLLWTEVFADFSALSDLQLNPQKSSVSFWRGFQAC